MPSLSSNPKYLANKSFWKAMDWIFPPVCAGCGINNAVLCGQCLTKTKILQSNLCSICGIPLHPYVDICKSCYERNPPYSSMRGWAEFDGPVRESIHSLKYKSNIGLGNFFSRYLIDVVLQNQWNIDLVVPIPLSKSHLKQRGYNQAAIISLPLALGLNIPHSTRAAYKIRETKSQAMLSANERYLNVEDAFLGNPAKLKGRRVLVVDDVITTGATMENCAKAILSSGAKEVFCLSVGRAIVKTQT
jgi:competence protein ComFC